MSENVGQAILPAAGFQAGQCRTWKGPAQPGLTAPQDLCARQYMLIHSCRSAAIGSSLDALRAGKYTALSDTNTSSPAANVSVIGSWGATP